jgi:hypothetical protein
VCVCVCVFVCVCVCVVDAGGVKTYSKSVDSARDAVGGWSGPRPPPPPPMPLSPALSQAATKVPPFLSPFLRLPSSLPRRSPPPLPFSLFFCPLFSRCLCGCESEKARGLGERLDKRLRQEQPKRSTHEKASGLDKRRRLSRLDMRRQEP